MKWATVAAAAGLGVACDASQSKHETEEREAPAVRQLGALQAPMPNIIFILVDDLGYGDLGSFWQDKGSRSAKKFDTPNLDRLAAEGVMLTHHYVGAPVCAPSRASLITGRHQGHADVRNSQFDKALPPNHTLGTVLRAGGYTTAWIGKAGLAGYETLYDLAGEGSRALPAHPLHRGFDRFFGYLFHEDALEHYPRNGNAGRTSFIYDDFTRVANASLDLYTTDAWTAAAKKFLIDQVGTGEKPFFLYLAYDTPHFDLQRPAVAYPALDDDGDPTTGGIQWTLDEDPSGNVRYASTADGSGVMDSYTEPELPDDFSDTEKRHVGMIRRIDRAVGDIVVTLKDLGVDENTLIVFSSDNGPHFEGNDPRTFESFANLEGIKRDVWEGGIRVPTIARWPAGITQATQDEDAIFELALPTGQWDWLPTFAALAGVPAPSWADGVSLVPSLTGGPGQRDKGYLYFEYFGDGATPDFAEFPNHRNAERGEMQAVRVGNHMGVRTQVASAEDDFQIYDVVSDPAESDNVAATMPELQAEMKALAIRGRRPGAGIVRPYDAAALPASVAPSRLKSGVSFKQYAGPFPWVPEFRDLKPIAIGSDSNFDPARHARDSDSGLFYEGFIQVPVAGDYTFYLASDAGASLHIHDAQVIDDDFNHDGSEISGRIALAAGPHAYRLYYRHVDAEHVLDVKWSGPDFKKQAIPPQNLLRVGDAAGAGGAGGVGDGGDAGGAGDAEGGAAGDGGGAAGRAGSGDGGSAAAGRGGGPGASGRSGSGGGAARGMKGGDGSGGCACRVVSTKPRSGTDVVAGWLSLIGLSLVRRARQRRRV